MSYGPEDAAWDEAYENMSRELYPEHKEQAIAEFTRERLPYRNSARDAWPLQLDRRR